MWNWREFSSRALPAPTCGSTQFVSSARWNQRGCELVASPAWNHGFALGSGRCGPSRRCRWSTPHLRRPGVPVPETVFGGHFPSFLEKEFPHLVENYRQRYQDRSFLPPSYGKRIAQLIAQFRDKYGIKRADPRGTMYANKWPVQAFDEQLALF